MTPAEFWRLHEAKRPRDPETDYAGSLTEKSVAGLWEMMQPKSTAKEGAE